MTDLGLLYVGAATLLFFFWAYGVVSFTLDLRNRVLPAVSRMVAARRARDRGRDGDTEDRDRDRLY